MCERERERVFNTQSTMTVISEQSDSKETEIIKVDKLLSIPVTNLHILEKETKKKVQCHLSLFHKMIANLRLT